MVQQTPLFEGTQDSQRSPSLQVYDLDLIATPLKEKASDDVAEAYEEPVEEPAETEAVEPQVAEGTDTRETKTVKKVQYRESRESEESDDRKPMAHVPSSTQGSVYGVTKMVEKFQACRKAEKNALFWVVLRRGGCCSSIGCLIFVVGTVSDQDILEGIGLFLVPIGLLAVSVCPSTEFDLDAALLKHPLFRVAMLTPWLLLAALWTVQVAPHAHCLSFLACLWVASGGLMPSRDGWSRVRFTTLISISFILCSLAWACTFLLRALDPDQRPEDQRGSPSSLAFWARFFYALATTEVFASHLFIQIRRGHRSFGLRLSYTRVFLNVLYYWLSTVGVYHIALSIYGFAADQGRPERDIVTGIVYCLPTLLVGAFGRENVFDFLARRFDRDYHRAKRDGAFVAELVSKMPVRMGQTWWVHHGKNLSHYSDGNHLRNWEPGIVVSLRRSHFAVRLRNGSVSPNSRPSGCPSPSPTAALPALCDDEAFMQRIPSANSGPGMQIIPSGESAVIVSVPEVGSPGRSVEVITASNHMTHIPSGGGGTRVQRVATGGSNFVGRTNTGASLVRSLSSGIFASNRVQYDVCSRSGGSGSAGSKNSPSNADSGETWISPTWRNRNFSFRGPVRWIPLPGFGAPANELLHSAIKNLRCIEWSNITEELMQGSICGPDSANFKSQYHLSRPVRPGEVIDFFMSHSWYDDWRKKIDRLQELVEKFRTKHGRDPTFWLDKACIDQASLGDCLKVLPINVMACRKVLVLIGDTYPSRLWCVWELFILFAFAREEQALEKVHVVSLNASGHSLNTLRNFNVADSSCYDPNEEARLHHVIRVVGVEAFNLKIRSLVAKITESDDS